MTAPQNRDHLLDHTLKHGLNSAAAWGAESECLDAETLAAWVDGGLDRQQAALTETHLSNCGQCQELLAALTQTLPPAVGAAAKGAHSRWMWWLAPITAAAAAALWMVVPHQNYLAVPAEPAVEVAQASPPVAPAPTTSAPAPPTPAPTPPAPAAPALASPPVAAAPASEPPPAARQQAPERARADDFRKPATARAIEDTAERAAPVPPAAPAPPAAAAPPPVTANRGAVAESKVATPPPPSPPVADPTAEPPFVAAPAPVPAAGAGATQIVSPDSRFRWRYSSAGLDYSANGGATWERVSAVIGPFITAGTSPSATVCWLVARGGSVYVTVDGRNFFRARFPEITNLSAVTATSGAVATVTTTDGRTFVTSDGGATWSRK